jgi:ligand-binding SRPBCC domain-containing protein
MSGYVFEARLTLVRPRAEVFRFFADPSNLPLITPPELHLVVETAVAEIAAGTVLDFRTSWFGVPARWRTLVREFDPPHRFVDALVRGPLARWEHRHMFIEDDGGTRIEDRVTYQLPWGPLGDLTRAVYARRKLESVWAYRSRRLGELLGPVKRSATEAEPPR